ncbi:hypothetical protein IGI37_000967 [Enterococcus sp. AZ194]
MQGKQNKEIAGMFHLNETTVGFYINSYLQGGLTALVPQKKSGRPPFMTKEQSQALYDVIRDYVPHDVGFPGRYNWTVSLQQNG